MHIYANCCVVNWLHKFARLSNCLHFDRNLIHLIFGNCLLWWNIRAAECRDDKFPDQIVTVVTIFTYVDCKRLAIAQTNQSKRLRNYLISVSGEVIYMCRFLVTESYSHGGQTNDERSGVQWNHAQPAWSRNRTPRP